MDAVANASAQVRDVTDDQDGSDILSTVPPRRIPLYVTIPIVLACGLIGYGLSLALPLYRAPAPAAAGGARRGGRTGGRALARLVGSISVEAVDAGGLISRDVGIRRAAPGPARPRAAGAGAIARGYLQVGQKEDLPWQVGNRLPAFGAT